MYTATLAWKVPYTKYDHPSGTIPRFGPPRLVFKAKLREEARERLRQKFGNGTMSSVRDLGYNGDQDGMGLTIHLNEVEQFEHVQKDRWKCHNFQESKLKINVWKCWLRAGHLKGEGRIEVASSEYKLFWVLYLIFCL